MTPVVPCSISNILLFPGAARAPRKANSSKRCYSSRKSSKHTLSFERFVLQPPTSVSLFSRYKSDFHHKLSATENDVAVTVSESPVKDENSAGASEIPGNAVTKEESAPAPARGFRNPRKSDVAPVKNEDLVPGASFTGKVRSVKPFGAFVDIGAFTNGLVHVSNLSDGFVKDVESIVSVGQEVKVSIIEVNFDTKRIDLSMREGGGSTKQTQQNDASSGSANRRPPRKSAPKKTSKFLPGENLVGTVKNLTGAGAFITLPEGEEGFLSQSEQDLKGSDGVTKTSLVVGEEVKVRVMGMNRGQVALTMKEEVVEQDFDTKLILQSKTGVATNPFELAFRKNNDIAMFLDERKKKDMVEPNISPENDKVDQIVTESDTTIEVQEPVVASTDVGIVNVPLAVDETTEDKKEASPEILALEGNLSTADQKTTEAVIESAKKDDVPEIITSIPLPNASGAELTTDKQEEVSSENSISITDPIIEEPVVASTDVGVVSVPATVDETPDVASAVLTTDKQEEASSVDGISITDQIIEEPVASADVGIVSVPATVDETPDVDSAVLTTDKQEVVSSVDSISITDQIIEEPVASADVGIVSEVLTTDKLEEASSEDSIPTTDQIIEETVASVDVGIVSAPATVNETAGVDSEVLTTDKQEEASSEISASEVLVSSESSIAQVEDAQTDNAEIKAEVITNTPIAKSEAPAAIAPVEEELKSLPEENISVTIPDVQSVPETKASISPALVKQLREESGAGMMDCKNALLETEGDIVKAQEFLRKKGLASAEKKASRATAEGRIGSYIHDGRIGVLVEVNCETDFVSRGDIFKELVEDVAMQVAACPQVQYIDPEDVPEEIVNKEKDLEMQKEDLLSKPEEMRSRIVEGRIKKMLGEMALLEQAYIKNDKVVVKDWVKQTIATVGENMKVKRFVRFNLGEGLEKKSQDFAADVAAQTTAKPVAAPKIEQPTPVEAAETVETRPPAVAVSAALVKQLRDETGAGMMDCKKALSETEGDLEKAQEYLRKKGLSSADKKSGRLAAEGRIGSYIHDSRIGVLIEVNCETDFVGRSEKFKQLVDDLAMQVVANPLVQFVSIDDIPESVVQKEKELEMQREDLQSKPEEIRAKIVEGRVVKRMGALALLEQPFIKDDSVLVKDLVKQTVAAIGENIKVRRFVKFTLGET